MGLILIGPIFCNSAVQPTDGLVSYDRTHFLTSIRVSKPKYKAAIMEKVHLVMPSTLGDILCVYIYIYYVTITLRLNVNLTSYWLELYNYSRHVTHSIDPTSLPLCLF